MVAMIPIAAMIIIPIVAIVIAIIVVIVAAIAGRAVDLFQILLIEIECNSLLVR